MSNLEVYGLPGPINTAKRMIEPQKVFTAENQEEMPAHGGYLYLCSMEIEAAKDASVMELTKTLPCEDSAPSKLVDDADPTGLLHMI